MMTIMMVVQDDGGDGSDTLEHEIHVTLGALVDVTETLEPERAMPDQPKDKDLSNLMQSYEF